MLRKTRERTRSETGFTVIEIVVIVLVIAIMVAIALPAFLVACFPLGGWALVIALVVVVAGVLLLATSRAVDALIGGGATLASEPESEAA